MLERIFFDSNGIFQWGSLTSISIIIAAVSLYFTSKDSKKGRLTDTIVKAQLERLGVVNNSMGEIAKVSLLFGNETLVEEKQNDKYIDDNKIEALAEVIKNYALIIGNINHENKFSEQIVSIFEGEYDQFNEEFSHSNNEFIELMNIAQELPIIVNKYTEQEWEIIKRIIK